MKTSVKVLGLGKRTTVEGKKGNYDFVPVSIAYRDENFTAGVRADTVCVSPEKIPVTLTVGEVVEMDLSRFRGKLKIVSIG